jgi:hypothetical protein
MKVRLGKTTTDITISDVHYCPELDTNLISLGVLERKGNSFSGKNDRLEVFNKKGELVLESKRKDNVYVLHEKATNKKAKTGVTFKAVKPANRELWHQRLGHVNKQDLEKLPQMAVGVKFNEQYAADKNFCEACVLGKQHKVHEKGPASHRATEAGDRIHGDLVGGKESLPAVSGYRYAAILTDDATRMRMAVTLKHKDDVVKETTALINIIEAHTKQPIRRWRCDAGEEWAGLTSTFKEKGILKEMSAPYAQDQDGVSERSIRTIIERARTMMLQANLPVKLWPEAIAAAVYITNRLPTKALQGKTPYEAWYSEKPDLSNLRVYGCDAYVVDYHAKSKGKMAPRSWRGTLVGYQAKNQWRIYNGKKVFVRRDVTFNENKFRFAEKGEPVTEGVTANLSELLTMLQPVGEGQRIGQISSQAEHLTDPAHGTQTPEQIEPQGGPQGEERITILDDGAINATFDHGTRNAEYAETEAAEEEAPQGRSQRQRQKHDYRQLNSRGLDANQRHQRGLAQAASDTTKASQIVTPTTYQQAMTGPQAKEWFQAMKAEYDSQIDRQTFQLTTLPYDQKAIDGKWVYKIKETEEGIIDRFKARWVAKGYRQVEGRDYEEKYAPVVRSDTSRILLAITAAKGWHCRQFDVSTAFLYGKMDRPLYTKQPTGFEKGDKVCLLNTALYGLVQSGHLWFEEIKSKLLRYGMTQSKHDDALFYSKSKELYFTLYVDDMKSYCPNDGEIDRLFEYLQGHYKMTDMGEVKWYLGMEIIRKDNAVIITQRKYITDLLEKYGMQECKSSSTPMAEKLLQKAPEDWKCGEKELHRYQKLIGEVMHLMVKTRPDIAYAVSRLAQFMSNPTEEHWTALKRMLRYLRGTIDYGIKYDGSKGATMEAWTDSSWGEDPDDAKSTNGYLIVMAGAPVGWKTAKQQSVATSSTEAEYYGQSMAAGEVMWARGLLEELEIEDTFSTNPSTIYADNQGAIKLANNPVFQKRTKHIAIRYHYTRDLIQQGQIKLEFKPTAEMMADGMTKPLGPEKFSKFVKMLGLETL